MNSFAKLIRQIRPHFSEFDHRCCWYNWPIYWARDYATVWSRALVQAAQSVASRPMHRQVVPSAKMRCCV